MQTYLVTFYNALGQQDQLIVSAYSEVLAVIEAEKQRTNCTGFSAELMANEGTTMQIKLTNLNTMNSITTTEQTEEQIAAFIIKRCGGGYHQFQIEAAMRYHAELLSTGSTQIDHCLIEKV